MPSGAREVWGRWQRLSPKMGWYNRRGMGYRKGCHHYLCGQSLLLISNS